VVTELIVVSLSYLFLMQTQTHALLTTCWHISVNNFVNWGLVPRPFRQQTFSLWIKGKCEPTAVSPACSPRFMNSNVLTLLVSWYKKYLACKICVPLFLKILFGKLSLTLRSSQNEGNLLINHKMTRLISNLILSDVHIQCTFDLSGFYF